MKDRCTSSSTCPRSSESSGDQGSGSCRTPESVDVHRALTEASEHLTSYGGHAAAAGLDIAVEHAPAFREAFEAAVLSQREGSAPARVSRAAASKVRAVVLR